MSRSWQRNVVFLCWLTCQWSAPPMLTERTKARPFTSLDPNFFILHISKFNALETFFLRMISYLNLRLHFYCFACMPANELYKLWILVCEPFMKLKEDYIEYIKCMIWLLSLTIMHCYVHASKKGSMLQAE